MSIFDNILKRDNQSKEKKIQSEESHPVKSKLEACQNCNKSVEKLYYEYPGKKKGDFGITQEIGLCQNCFFKRYNQRQIDDKKRIEVSSHVIIALQSNLHQKSSESTEKLKDALAKFKIIFDKTSSKDWYTKGNLLANLKDESGALNCYDEALLIDTHYTKAWYRKGSILFYHKKYEDAIKCYDNVMVLDRNNENNNRSWYLAALISKVAVILVEYQSLINDLPAIAKEKYKGKIDSISTEAYKAKIIELTKMELHKYLEKHSDIELKELLKQIYNKIETNPDVRGFPPKEQRDNLIQNGKFADMLKQNYSTFLDTSEPNEVAHVSVSGERH